MAKIVINTCYGGYGLSDAAYEWLAKEYGIPVRKYIKEVRGKDGLFIREPQNDDVILDRDLEEQDKYIKAMKRLSGRFWDTGWASKRDDPRIVACVEALGDKANGNCAKLKVVEIPDGVEWEIDEYDGIEHVEERHRTWS